MAELTFYRLSQDSKESDHSYEEQNLELSKYFGKWPNELKLSENGQVELVG